MKAAVLHRAGEIPTVEEFEDPGGPSNEIVDVVLAGCNPVDILLASGDMGEPTTPSVVGKEGIGITAAGQRVYFDSPPDPYGSWAQRCRINRATTYPVPDGLDDDLAVALGIAGLAAWLPLTRHANVENGQSVLVLGATGVVGCIAIQAAKLLGAGRVVGAGRDPDKLKHAVDLGADATVRLGEGDDAEALRDEAGDGYDVVIDTVYGDPFLAALDATANGATLVTIGLGAGASADIPFQALTGRTHVGHLNDAMPPQVLRTAYDEITKHAAAGDIQVETHRYSLDDAAAAWQAQKDGPSLKIAVAP